MRLIFNSIKPALIVFFVLFTVPAFAQSGSGIVTFRNPASVAAAKGYSHAAEVDLGNCKMLIISGQVALDKQGNLVGKNDLAKQTEQVFLNIRNIVSESGGTMDNVVKLGFYLTNVSQIQAVRDIRNKFINMQAPPASTLVEVSRLFREDILIEIEATAIIPKK